MKRTILLIEDEPDDVFFLTHALKKAGIRNPVHVLESGQAAIDYLSGAGKYADRRTYPLPGLILLDLKLPLVPGLTVLKWIREQPHLPPMAIVVLTSSSLPADIENSYRLGANSYVVKPSAPDQLLELIKDFRNWWFKHHEPLPQDCLPD